MITADPELRVLLGQIIMLEKWVGQTEYGDASYGSKMQVACRIEGKVRMVRTVEGLEQISTTTIYVYGDRDVPMITTQDRITLPSPPYTAPIPNQPPIIAVIHMPDETGELYQEIMT